MIRVQHVYTQPWRCSTYNLGPNRRKIYTRPLPPPPQKKKLRMGKWRALAFARLHSWYRRSGGLLSHFILSKNEESLGSFSFIRRSWSQTVSWFPLVFVKIYFWQNFTFSGFFLQLLLIVKGLEGFCLPEREKNIHTLVLTNSSTCVLRLWFAGTKTRL